jgi:hypothetical protein
MSIRPNFDLVMFHRLKAPSRFFTFSSECLGELCEK